MGYVYRPRSTAFSIYSKGIEIIAGAIAGTVDLHYMYVPDFKGTLTRVTVDIIIGSIMDTSGANNFILTPQQIKIWDGTAYRNSDILTDYPFIVTANVSIGGSLFIYTETDLKQYINKAGNYYVRLENLTANGDFLYLNGVYSRLNFYLS